MTTIIKKKLEYTGELCIIVLRVEEKGVIQRPKHTHIKIKMKNAILAGNYQKRVHKYFFLR